jgi:dihydroorotate dehydrogenase
MPTLSTTVDGLKLPNPFIIASSPPGDEPERHSSRFPRGLGRCHREGHQPRRIQGDQRHSALRQTSRQRQKRNRGPENIELISDRPIENWLGEFKRCKDQNPNGILIASIMEEYNRDAWIEIIERCQDAGVDGFELNFSCPHGLPERKMGSARGEDPEILLLGKSVSPACCCSIRVFLSNTRRSLLRMRSDPRDVCYVRGPSNR